MFSLPPGDGKVIEGRSDANPIYLSSVTVIELEMLIQYLFNGYVPTRLLNRTADRSAVGRYIRGGFLECMTTSTCHS